jgi:hypothetical protein
MIGSASIKYSEIILHLTFYFGTILTEKNSCCTVFT